MKKIMKEKNQVVPNEVLRKEFLSQFKTEADVSKFLKQLHAQVLEKMLEGEMDAHLGYEKNSVTGNNTGNRKVIYNSLQTSSPQDLLNRKYRTTRINEFQKLNSSRFLIFRKSRFKGNMFPLRCIRLQKYKII